MTEKSKLQLNKKAPEFCLPDKDRNEICLKDFHGKWVILYFYPKDNTPGCTMEAKDFTDAKRDFLEKNTEILGVSKDSPESHCKFTDKKELEITLLSDQEHKVLENYGSWKPKKMYGKEFLGTVRSTFLIDPQGKIAFMWPRVKARGHVSSVMEKLVELQAKR